ncbi:arylamine N-acetyltransferase [Halalkalibacterium halodurans]|uniref:BH2181 protein n=1 Tax=Halalkalibacterium halodurans (strain ATCC BAA-125 / DSM 18197 / FERM 7344 / JCM 9153 / C-125) TaxID=272558 RepID=Q9KAV5_HALH5|nr:arylamine N-acetyltransferase [Halalkalibacterium halodurans]MED4082777.1 arylamine N-acetyltransferase [Halalkalibacterium halodurans]MED4087253.1 arylamine N-acetyltransferase [Halalkalibacterium halodurans]MED4105730.1 arylamine N-acetyltransferase [Halalkalibacterium halodurans]MED4110902.1 arylamine N-acetyltransferase [Halalkalibacterium halodurans]MED4149962.1 arylamine N-acetyltransferase [Halalkalibacterium halodurans]
MDYQLNCVKNYLSLLQLPINQPSYDYLARICQAHLSTFPFENISKLLFFRNRQIGIPTMEQFLSHYKSYHYGGTCYTLNANLFRLLQALGFDTYPVMLGGEHLGIIVQMDDEPFYVDCGATAPLFSPVRLEGHATTSTRFGRDVVLLQPDDTPPFNYKYIRIIDGEQSGNTWYFHSHDKKTINDFLPALERSYQLGTTFMTILRCHLYQPDQKRSVSLVNSRLTVRYDNGETVVTMLESEQEIEEVLSDEFKLSRLPVRKAIAVLKQLSVDLFTES